MTRKRFVKLLMSEGYSRNEAIEYAAWLNNAVRGSYKDAYIRFLIDRENPDFEAALRRFMEAAADAVRRMADAIAGIDWSQAAEAIAQNKGALQEALGEYAEHG